MKRPKKMICPECKGEGLILGTFRDVPKDELYQELIDCPTCKGLRKVAVHWWTGNCICSNCSHTWVCVMPIPKTDEYPKIKIECPECHKMEGLVQR